MKRITGATSVDDYLARVDEPARSVLDALRAQIRAAAPKAEEVISYQIPTYKLHGPLVHFAAQPKHLAFTLVSAGAVDAAREALPDFDITGRTIRFSPKRPIPARVVARLVKQRVKENEARAAGLDKEQP